MVKQRHVGGRGGGPALCEVSVGRILWRKSAHLCVREDRKPTYIIKRKNSAVNLGKLSRNGAVGMRPSTCICSHPDDMCSYCLSKRKTGPCFPHFSHEELQGHDGAASEISPGGVI